MILIGIWRECVQVKEHYMNMNILTRSQHSISDEPKYRFEDSNYIFYYSIASSNTRNFERSNNTQSRWNKGPRRLPNAINGTNQPRWLGHQIELCVT